MEDKEYRILKAALNARSDVDDYVEKRLISLELEILKILGYSLEDAQKEIEKREPQL